MYIADIHQSFIRQVFFRHFLLVDRLYLVCGLSSFDNTIGSFEFENKWILILDQTFDIGEVPAWFGEESGQMSTGFQERQAMTSTFLSECVGIAVKNLNQF